LPDLFAALRRPGGPGPDVLLEGRSMFGSPQPAAAPPPAPQPADPAADPRPRHPALVAAISPVGAPLYAVTHPFPADSAHGPAAFSEWRIVFSHGLAGSPGRACDDGLRERRALQ
jgi:hypothetical protein